ncbi:MAG: hypothetical protein QNL04_14805 [SAR324 cluster bacterium]|nr:hypothetical protein [SAR324 cluster bacterium]
MELEIKVENRLDRLSEKEKKWLSQVIWQLIKGNNWVTAAEYPYLHEAMKWASRSEFERLEKDSAKGNFLCVSESLESVDRDTAFRMIAILVEVALSDQKLAIVEMSIIENAMSLLGFDEDAIVIVLAFAEELTQRPSVIKNPRNLVI